jgi:hypothetical protein
LGGPRFRKSSGHRRTWPLSRDQLFRRGCFWDGWTTRTGLSIVARIVFARRRRSCYRGGAVAWLRIARSGRRGSNGRGCAAVRRIARRTRRSDCQRAGTVAGLRFAWGGGRGRHGTRAAARIRLARPRCLGDVPTRRGRRERRTVPRRVRRSVLPRARALVTVCLCGLVRGHGLAGLLHRLLAGSTHVVRLPFLRCRSRLPLGQSLLPGSLRIKGHGLGDGRLGVRAWLRVGLRHGRSRRGRWGRHAVARCDQHDQDRDSDRLHLYSLRVAPGASSLREQ